MVGTSGTRSRPIHERAAPLERGKSSDTPSVSPGRRSRNRRRHRKQGAKRAILQANGIPTGKSRRRRRIDELESKVAFMEKDRKEQVGGLWSTIRRLQSEVRVLRGWDSIRSDKHYALEDKHEALANEVRKRIPCALDHPDWKGRFCGLEQKIADLTAHPEHWHVTALRRAMGGCRTTVW